MSGGKTIIFFIIYLIFIGVHIYLYMPSYIKSFVSAPLIERNAKTSDIKVRITGKTALSAIVRSPIFACVKKINRKEEIIVAFEDFIAIPMNRAIKLMVTVTIDFTISWI